MDQLVYRFEESGVGCADHGSTDCLCDVQALPHGVPIRKVPRSHDYPAFGGSEANRFVVWASMTLGRFEALIGVNQTELFEAKGQWDGATFAPHRTSAVSRCLKAGLTIDQTARWLGASRNEVMDVLWSNRDRHDLILRLEPEIRSRQKSATQIAKEFGLKGNYVSMLSRTWGVKLPHATQQNDPVKVGNAQKWARENISHREIARRLDMSQSWVQRVCKGINSKPGPKGKRKHD